MKNTFGIDFFTSLSGKIRGFYLPKVALTRNHGLIYLSALRKKHEN